ncbi:MAG: CCA tRNA nucleotidyltransferase [Desulfosalsimonas sp.]
MIFINPKFIPEKNSVYLVGGCVRDHLLGRPVSDYDLAVDCDAHVVARHIASAAGRRVVVMGEADKRIFRIVTEKETYDVSEIKGADIAADLWQRDFTINAMAVNTATKEIIDPTGGRDDLSKKSVRMVLPEAFDTDPLRLLRAFRMAAVLGFSIDPETLAAITAKSEKIAHSAGERIREEWLKMLESAFSAKLVTLAQQTGLLYTIFPEIFALKNCSQNKHHRFDALRHTLAVYQSLETMLHENRPDLKPGARNTDLLTCPGSPVLIKHAALFHDIGKPSTRSVDGKGDIHFYGHDKKGEDIIGKINTRIRFSNKENQYTSFLVGNHLRPLFLYMMRERGKLQKKAVTRFFIKTAPWTPDLLMLAAADSEAKDRLASVKFIKFIKNIASEYVNTYLPASRQPNLITGRDLIEEFGLKPSPLFSEIIDKIEEMRLAGLLKNRDQALKFISKKWGQIYF